MNKYVLPYLNKYVTSNNKISRAALKMALTHGEVDSEMMLQRCQKRLISAKICLGMQCVPAVYSKLDIFYSNLFVFYFIIESKNNPTF